MEDIIKYSNITKEQNPSPLPNEDEICTTMTAIMLPCHIKMRHDLG
jgi:hypothetical protein